jgi:hypothetical protein
MGTVTTERRERALAAARRHRPAVARLHADVAELARRTGGLLGQARGELDADYLLGVRSGLGLAAGELARIAADDLGRALAVCERVAEVLGDPGRCGLPWGVCPRCLGLGQGLSSSGRLSWCPGCWRRWPDLDMDPCLWPVAATVTDRHGDQLRLCASHATNATRRLAGARVVWDRSGTPDR